MTRRRSESAYIRQVNFFTAFKEQQNVPTIIDSKRVLSMMAEFDKKKEAQSALFKFVQMYTK